MKQSLTWGSHSSAPCWRRCWYARARRSPWKTSDLIDDVWGDAAPATAARVIRSYIYRLRLALDRDQDRDRPGRIRSAGGGYALDPGPRLDLARFADLAARARQARRDGDPATAAALFAEKP